MSHGLLEILKYFFLAILWLFFIYAARMVLVDARRTRSDRRQTPDDRKEQPERRAPVKLRVTQGPFRGETIELARELTFGRSTSCDISLEGDTYASSVHARMLVRDNDVIVEDLGSTNGTRVNNELTEGPVIVDRGDIVQIGGTILEVRR
jgi:hypothetical protein